jgi:hypothetical protein
MPPLPLSLLADAARRFRRHAIYAMLRCHAAIARRRFAAMLIRRR